MYVQPEETIATARTRRRSSPTMESAEEDMEESGLDVGSSSTELEPQGNKGKWKHNNYWFE